ncbi:unnamed protein product [Plutella xylostella]|uniref:(diamondback moth) hypothetical protein n=1 Tax=Plutella xylostella TaxID=51655 RepID=A0A8S4ES21_PLUXY|nr:unnamed protein product [Plutella xylostella]
MRSATFVVALAALIVVCSCAPKEDKKEQVPSGLDMADVRVRRSVGGQESDLLPEAGDVDASPFGEASQLAGRARGIRVLPAFLG